MGKINLNVIDRRIILAFFLLSPILSVVNFPGKYAVVSSLFVSAFFYYYRFRGLKLITSSYPLILWLILTIYHWVNGMQKNVPEVDILDLLHGLKIYACIAIFAFLARRNFEETVKSLLICFFIYLTMSFFVNDTSSEDFNGRMSGVMFATGLGQTAALSGIYIAYYALRNRLSIARSGALYILPTIVILLTQSRNSLGMLGIGIIGHALAYSVQRGLNIKKILIVVLTLAAFSFFILDFLIINTDIGARLTNIESVQESQSINGIATGTFFDNIVGDRLVYYVVGWRYFLESPLTGIGMWNFKWLTQGDYPLHSEYMVHLSEGGLIGASIWLLFIISIFKGIFKSDKYTYIKIIACFSIIEILFCGIYARVFYYEFFYPIIGIAISISFWGRERPKKIIKHI